MLTYSWPTAKVASSRHISSFPRHAVPESCSMHRPRNSKRAQGRPGAGRTHGPPADKKAGGRHHRIGRTSGLPCAMVLTVSFVLPGNRALLLPSSARSSLADLTPASGCQDHTTSPSARAPFVRTTARARRLASIAARLTSGDDWPSRPS